ncbi:hypothetical protein COJ85_32050 [Bacillus sp. AFS076308]|uniref:hypothetical protein n=1 Tax=unclassified Bacillus (in: firmicutes) TaxID=185979 RepID=UPI000BF39F96|nr:MULTISPECIES: hypothetical protein [unclassified Bacillus (in: firmicutes)]PFN77603.1 hypothetical protein COJ85_32050 [Bacillus sp. AFS076308]PGV45316.1 hypothetical protein COD92_30870 [Bacillus sp. AFS037270]
MDVKEITKGMHVLYRNLWDNIDYPAEVTRINSFFIAGNTYTKVSIKVPEFGDIIEVNPNTLKPDPDKINTLNPKKTRKKPREDHCFGCKKPLSENIDRICSVCGWMKCKCSACGCNYKGYSF